VEKGPPGESVLVRQDADEDEREQRDEVGERPPPH
jgi:hypothetical protein